ncbi:MAG: TIGR00266 family protein [Solirubrobacterales bacterium]|nr:TIGR00266 family protein [Solirubrobacterales bacterium]HMT05340.1 TIGR00266 family protein [Solirubrobacterales bacterium]
MNTEIRHNPGFAVARCTLAGGEQMRAESGAMAATSAGVEIEAKVQGGLMKGLKRSMLGGESLFMTTLTAPSGGGWVDVAANLPGDAMVLPVGEEIFLTQGAYLASDATVDIDTKWGGFKNIGGGEGGFLIRATGSGVVVASCYGAIDRVELAAGERIVVDSGHLVAFEPSVQYKTRKASSGIMNTLKSGEGFVMEFTGPGVIHTQTRDPGFLVSWLTEVLPFTRS